MRKWKFAFSRFFQVRPAQAMTVPARLVSNAAFRMLPWRSSPGPGCPTDACRIPETTQTAILVGSVNETARLPITLISDIHA